MPDGVVYLTGLVGDEVLEFLLDDEELAEYKDPDHVPEHRARHDGLDIEDLEDWSPPANYEPYDLPVSVPETTENV